MTRRGRGAPAQGLARKSSLFPVAPYHDSPSVTQRRNLEAMNRHRHIGFRAFDAFPYDLV